MKAEQVVGLVHVEPFTPELAQSHQVPELTFLKDQKLALAPNIVDSWESIARSTVQILSKVEIMANAAIVLLDKHIIANNPLNSPQEDLTSLRTLVGQAYGTLTNGQACAVTQLSNVILHRRDAWLSNMGDQAAKQLRIAPLFGPTLFPSNVINKTRQEYIQDNKMSLVVSSATKVTANTTKTKAKVEPKVSTEAKGQVAAAAANKTKPPYKKRHKSSKAAKSKPLP